MWKKALALAVVVATIGSMVGQGALSVGQETRAAKKARGRLPAYFADIVTEDQRTAIYKIQESYKKQIDDLESQLAAVREKEINEIEAVLDAEQKEKLKKAREEAAGKRKKKAPEAAAETDPAKPAAAPKPATTTKPAKTQ
jgi:TolA-binding protein